MRNETMKKAGLAAVILLAPGGFILGIGLAAAYHRRKRAEAAEARSRPSNGPDSTL